MDVDKYTLKDVFLMSDGTSGALAELERRKFTAQEGVRDVQSILADCSYIHCRIT